MSEESQGGVKRFPLTEEQIKEINQAGREVFFDYFHDYENKNAPRYTTRYAIMSGPSYSRLLEGLGKIDEHEFELCNGTYTLQLGISASFKNVDMKVFSGTPPESLKHDAIAIKIIEFSRSKIQQTLERIIREEEQKVLKSPNPPPESSSENYLKAA
jgi:hypothetical protein